MTTTTTNTVPGRRFVLIAAGLVAAGAAGLAAAFAGWKGRYEALAAYGAERVAPTVDPLARLDPPGIDPAAWRDAVGATRAMLVALTAAGALDLSQMDALRTELETKVARSSSPTARADLASVWDDLERRAGPLMTADSGAARHPPRHPRPPRPAVLGRGAPSVGGPDS